MRHAFRIFCAALVLLSLGGISACGGEEPPPHVHAFSEAWSSDETAHWHDATCGHDARSDFSGHVFSGGVCKVCGRPAPASPPQGEGPPAQEEDPPPQEEEPPKEGVGGDVLGALHASLLEETDLLAAFTGDFDVDASPLSGDGAPDSDRGAFGGRAAGKKGDAREADFMAEVSRTDGARYLLAFLRGGKTYSDGAEWPAEAEAGDFGAVLARYFAEGGPALKAEASAASGIPGLLASAPALWKLLKNAVVYCGAPAAAEGTGYAIGTDLLSVADKMLGDVGQGIAELERPAPFVSVGMNPLGTLLRQPSVEKMLKTLLRGVTAEESRALAAFASSRLPFDLSALPKPLTSDMGAFDYLWQCLNSKELLLALADSFAERIPGSGAGALFGYGGLADIPLMVFRAAAGEGLPGFDRDEVLAKIEAIRADLMGSILRRALGEDAVGSFSWKVKAVFDAECAFSRLEIRADFEKIEGRAAVAGENGETVYAVRLGAHLSADVVPTRDPPALADLSGCNPAA